MLGTKLMMKPEAQNGNKSTELNAAQTFANGECTQKTLAGEALHERLNSQKPETPSRRDTG
jgi:hypothetical protein